MLPCIVHKHEIFEFVILASVQTLYKGGKYFSGIPEVSKKV